MDYSVSKLRTKQPFVKLYFSTIVVFEWFLSFLDELFCFSDCFELMISMFAEKGAMRTYSNFVFQT